MYYLKNTLFLELTKNQKASLFSFIKSFVKKHNANNLSVDDILELFIEDEKYYYDMLTYMTGTRIENQIQLIKMVREMASQRSNYIKVNEAISKVRNTGYGIVTPDKEEIVLENPELIRSGNKYGVKIKATAPSIHFVKANILTEISPIIGSEEQAKDLIDFINNKESEDNIWETNIFGKSIGQIVDEGIMTKINNLTEETQSRMQGTIEKITNDQSRGVICIVL